MKYISGFNLIIFTILFITNSNAQLFESVGSLDGTGDYYFSDNLLPNNDYTIEFWFRMCDPADTNHFETLLTNNSTIQISLEKDICYACDSLHHYEFAIKTCLDGDLTTACGASGVGSYASPAGDEWKYFVVQYDKSEHRFNYQPNGEWNSSYSQTDFETGNKDFYLGKSFSLVGPSKGFKAMIEEVRVSDYLRYLPTYDIPAGPLTADIHTIALWHFDEADSLGIIEDASGNNHDLVPYGDAGIYYEYSAIIEGPDTIYAGEPAIFTAAGKPDGAWDNWLIDGAMIDDENGAVTIICPEPGIYQIILSTGDNSGCTELFDTMQVVVIVNPVCTIMNTEGVEFCAGAFTELYLPEGYTYLWSTGDTTSSIIVSESGLYSVAQYYFSGDSSFCSQLISVNELPEIEIDSSGPLTFCDGNSVLLNIDDVYDCLWNIADTSNIISVNESGIYAVTATDENGCIGNDSVVVTILELPICEIIADPVSFCTGDSTVLMVSEAENYSWNTGDTTQFIISYEGGEFSVFITDISGCSSSDTIHLEIHEPSLCSIITVDSILCEGDSTILTAVFATEYLWNTGDTTQSVWISNEGNYEVMIINEFGCVSECDQDIIINSLPDTTITIDNSPEFCKGDSVTLTAATGYSYLWNDASTDQSITVYISGIYSVLISDSMCSSTGNIEITVYDNPICFISVIGETIFYEGDSAQLIAPDDYYYEWSTGSTDQSINVFESGDYSVTITDTNGCWSNCEILITVIEENIGTIENDLSTVKLYPNITTGLLTIENSLQDLDMYLFSMQGDIVFSSQIATGQHIFDFSNLGKGYFFLRLTGSNQTVVYKLLFI
jgi:hypothetical protein